MKFRIFEEQQYQTLSLLTSDTVTNTLTTTISARQIMSNVKESDQAKEERLREKLKRKAEEIKTRGDEVKATKTKEPQEPLSSSKSKNDEKTTSPSSDNNRNNRGRRNRRNQRKGQNNMVNRNYDGGSYYARPGRGGGGPYRGDPYGRGDWRRDGPPGYDHYRGGRNGYGYGWPNNGGHDYDRPVNGYWREGFGPYHHDRERFGRNSSNNRNTMSREHVRDGKGRGGETSPRKERGRSRSRSFSRSRTSSERSCNSRSYRSRSSSRSSGGSRSSSRSRSSRSDRSLSKSRSRSRSASRSPTHDRRSSKRSRSGSHETESSDEHGKKKSRSESHDDNNDDNELTKDQRTIFVSQLVMRTTEKDIMRFFRKSVGCKVKDVQLLKDKRTGRHKGSAYVELGRLEDVPRAVEASGKTPEFQRFPILVKASEAEKNYGIDGMPVVEVPSSSLTKRVEAQKVYIGSIDRNVTQAQLYAIFSQFGDLEKVVLQVDTATGMSKGFAFLSYKDPKVANLAIQAMSGQVLAGRPL